jgi:hypothetical protein
MHKNQCFHTHQEDFWDGSSQSEDLFEKEAPLHFNAAFKGSVRTRAQTDTRGAA